MKKLILFDTNVILDVLLERQPHCLEAMRSMDAISQGKAVGFVSAHTVTTLYYVLSRHAGVEKTREILADLLQTISVATVSEETIKQALKSRFRDFEDAVTHFAALETKVSAIVTRNIKDFTHSEVPAILPEIFNARL